VLNKTLSKTDIIDFDYFIDGVDLTMDNEEERRLFLNKIDPELTANEKTDPGKIIPLWLQAKRDKSSKLSPGQIVNSGFRLIFFIFVSTGFLTGMGAALSYLSYSGTRPVNITIYLFVFVFSQIFFQTLSLITLLSSRFNCLSDFFNTPYSLVLLLIKKATTIGSGKISSENRMSIDASIGKIKINREKFGKIYFWTIFEIFQMTGLVFSTGVLVATLFKVITSDLAFGWQTTIQTAPEKIFDMVRGFALPWSWMMSPDMAFPSLKNIVGSQILLKDSIVNLTSSDMAAWWPFLCFAVLFYTILPRVLLIFSGMFFERRAIIKTFLNNKSTGKLIRLLTCPQMVFEKNKSVPDSKSETDKSYNLKQNNNYFTSSKTVIVLIPEDIYSTNLSLKLEEKSKGIFGVIPETLEVTGDMHEDSDIISNITKRFEPESSGIILIVYESWLPPIKETIDYIKSIREHAGKSINIIVWLTGKPGSNDEEYYDVDDNDFKIWNWKIQAMGDTNISLAKEKK